MRIGKYILYFYNGGTAAFQNKIHFEFRTNNKVYKKIKILIFKKIIRRNEHYICTNQGILQTVFVMNPR